MGFGRLLRFFCVLSLGVGLTSVAWTPTAQSQQTAAVSATQTLHVSAVPVRGAAPLKESIAYAVIALDGKKRGQLVAEHIGPSLKVDLPKGRYRISAIYGSAESKADVVLDKEPLFHQAIFNSGGISMELIPYFGAKPIQDDLEWIVWTFGKDSSGNRWEVARSVGPTSQFTLPQGYYVVTAKHHDALAKHTIEVTAGIDYNYTINLNAGTMRIYSTVAEGAQPDSTIIWKVYPYGSDGSGEPLVTKAPGEDTLLLPEGRYLLVGHNGGKQIQKEIEVVSGKKSSVKMKF